MFLLFSTPQASSSSYLRQYAGSKTYSSLKMKPLQQASAQTAARAAESRTGSIETGGQRFTTYLTGERVAVPAKASGNTAAKVPAERPGVCARTSCSTPADPQPAQPENRISALGGSPVFS